MLKVTRCPGESLFIGNSLKITIVDVEKAERPRDTTVKLGFEEVEQSTPILTKKGDQNGS